MAHNEYGTSTTSTERTRTQAAQDGIRKFANTAKDKMKGTGKYLSDRPMKDVAGDARKYVVSHPGQALCGAVAAGFVAGRLLRRG